MNMNRNLNNVIRKCMGMSIMINRNKVSTLLIIMMKRNLKKIKSWMISNKLLKKI